jgi:hypothetical protein
MSGANTLASHYLFSTVASFVIFISLFIFYVLVFVVEYSSRYVVAIIKSENIWAYTNCFRNMILISGCLVVMDVAKLLTLNCMLIIDQRCVRNSIVPDKIKLCFHAGQSFSVKKPI